MATGAGAAGVVVAGSVSECVQDCTLAVAGSGVGGSVMAVKIYNLLDNSPQRTQRTQSCGNNVFALFAVKLKKRNFKSARIHVL